MEDLNKILAEILEVDEVNDEDLLDSFESWDSLTTLSIIASCHEEFGIVLRADDINSVKSIKELKDFIMSKRGRVRFIRGSNV